VRLEVTRDGERVVAVPLHAERQSFNALEEQPGVVRRQTGAEVAQRHQPHAQNIRQRGQFPEIMRIAQSVVTGVRFGQERETAAFPVEASRIHHDAADGGSVAAQPFGQRMDHNIRALFQRTLEVGCAEGAVHDQRQPMGMGHLGNCRDIGHVQRGIADGFHEAQLGPRRHGTSKVLRIARIHKDRPDAQLRQDVVELSVGAPVQVVGGYEFVARLAEINDRVKDRACPGRQRQCCGPALQRGHPFLQDGLGGIHDSGVDVAQLLKTEQIGGVGRAPEHVRTGAVHRYGAGQGYRVRFLAGMQCQRLNMSALNVHALAPKSYAEISSKSQVDR